jgi:hypothetical protein
MRNIINQRSLFVAVVAVLAPLTVLWIEGVTAQETARQPPRAFPESRREQSVDLLWGSRTQEAHEREAQTRKLLADYSQTEDEKDRAKVLDELTKVVSEQFDLRQEVRERELKDLEVQVRKLRELQQRRAKEKDLIIRDRVRQLLRDVDGLGWGDDGHVNGPVPVGKPRPPVADSVQKY